MSALRQKIGLQFKTFNTTLVIIIYRYIICMYIVVCNTI